MEYKATLNLPQTSFPMKANLPEREPEMLAKWEREQLYQHIQEAGPGRTRYVLHDGPPYANGRIHIGHALNKILKDVIVKSKTMEGYHAPYVPGWDCHGLPIEHQVLKDLGEIYFMLGQPEEAEPYTRRAIDMFKRTIGDGSRVDSCEGLLVRLKWAAGDTDAAAALLATLNARQAAAQAAGQSSALLLPNERLMLDALGLGLRAAPDAEFDVLIGKGREMSMQVMDLIELMEIKAASALRAGRRADGIRWLEEALAEADKNAQLTSDRLRRQLERATAPAAMAAQGS